MNLGFSESETVEFKKSTSEMKEGMASIAAMLNKHGRGALYFGVRNDGEVVGQDVADTTLRQISQAVRNSILPAIRPIITEESSDDGRAYVKVEFSGDDAPYSCGGRYRIRIADEDVPMTPDEVRSMVLEAENRRNPWDRRASNRPASDVDERELRDYVARGNDCGRIGFPYDDAESVLKRLGLMADGALTNAAEVLFCPSALPMLKMGVLANRTRTEILDLQHVSGTLFELARKAEFYILSNIRRRFIIDGSSLQRDEVPELPMDAVREVILNGLAHRDYRSDVPMMVDIHRDTVEIYNPGWFPEGHTPEAHLAGEDSRPGSPNGLIASTLFKSKDIESYASGLPRVQAACDEAGVKIEYRRVPGGTLAVFHRNDPFANAEEGSGKVPEKVPEKFRNGTEGGETELARTIEGFSSFGRTQQRACLIAAEEGSVSAARLAAEAGISDRAARKSLESLANRGILVASKATKGRRYTLSADVSSKM